MSKYKGLFTFDEDNHRYVPIAQADGIIDTMDYESGSEPAEPLIKDEKIRKAVRAWAEACRLKYATYKQSSNEFYDPDTRGKFAIKFTLKPIEVWLDDGKCYTIAELCGEEEE